MSTFAMILDHCASFTIASAPWWDEPTSGAIGGYLGAGVGVAGAVVGSLAGYLVPRGQGRTLLLATLGVLAALGALFAGAAAVALTQSQPFHVWYPLALAGGMMVVVFTPLFFVLRAQFARTEQHRLAGSLAS